MAHKAGLTIFFGVPSFLSLLTFSSAGLTLSCVGVGSLASGSDSLIMILTTWVLVMIVTSCWREYFRGNFTAVTACRNACIHDCLSFWPNTFFRLPE